MWETGTLSEGVSGRIWVEMGLQCLWAVFGNFTPFEGVGRWGRIGPEMGAPSEGGTISRETAHLRKMGKGRKEGECGYRLCRAHGAGTHLWKVRRNGGKQSHLRKVGRVRPEDSGVRWLDGLRSRKVG